MGAKDHDKIDKIKEKTNGKIIPDGDIIFFSFKNGYLYNKDYQEFLKSFEILENDIKKLNEYANRLNNIIEYVNTHPILLGKDLQTMSETTRLYLNILSIKRKFEEIGEGNLNPKVLSQIPGFTEEGEVLLQEMERIIEKHKNDEKEIIKIINSLGSNDVQNSNTGGQTGLQKPKDSINLPEILIGEDKKQININQKENNGIQFNASSTNVEGNHQDIMNTNIHNGDNNYSIAIENGTTNSEGGPITKQNLGATVENQGYSVGFNLENSEANGSDGNNLNNNKVNTDVRAQNGEDQEYSVGFNLENTETSGPDGNNLNNNKVNTDVRAKIGEDQEYSVGFNLENTETSGLDGNNLNNNKVNTNVRAKTGEDQEYSVGFNLENTEANGPDGNNSMNMDTNVSIKTGEHQVGGRFSKTKTNEGGSTNFGLNYGNEDLITGLSVETSADRVNFTGSLNLLDSFGGEINIKQDDQNGDSFGGKMRIGDTTISGYTGNEGSGFGIEGQTGDIGFKGGYKRTTNPTDKTNEYNLGFNKGKVSAVFSAQQRIDLENDSLSNTYGAKIDTGNVAVSMNTSNNNPENTYTYNLGTDVRLQNFTGHAGFGNNENGYALQANGELTIGAQTFTLEGGYNNQDKLTLATGGTLQFEGWNLNYLGAYNQENGLTANLGGGFQLNDRSSVIFGTEYNGEYLTGKLSGNYALDGNTNITFGSEFDGRYITGNLGLARNGDNGQLIVGVNVGPNKYMANLTYVPTNNRTRPGERDVKDVKPSIIYDDIIDEPTDEGG